MLSVESIGALLLAIILIMSTIGQSEKIFYRYFAYEKANNMADMLVNGAPRDYLDKLAAGYCYEIDHEKKCNGEAYEACRDEWIIAIEKRCVRTYVPYH